MKKNNLVKNASVLMIATMISRVIGLIYRRPLGQVLGNVGLGYYGYASNLYAILLLVSSYSIPMAVSKIVSERLALKQYKNAQKVFRGALMYAAIVGGIAALVAFFGGSILLPSNQQNAVPALRVLAPTIFLSAILGVLRGYFQAHHSMTPTSISQVLEQIMNAIVSVTAAYLLVKNLVKGSTEAAIYGAVGGTMGTAAGVLTGLIVMLIIYMINRPYFRKESRMDPTKGSETYRQVFGIIFMMVTPIIFTTFVNNVGAYMDSYLYSMMLDKHMAADAISAAYGEYSNYYYPIMNIPLALASASASAMMPEVSGEYALHNLKTVNGHVNKTISLTMFLCIPSMIGLTVLAYPIMGVLFPSSTDLAAKLLLTGSIYVLFAALSTITGSVLQSIGKQRVTLINAAIALVVNLIILAILLIVFPDMSIYAVMVANIFYALAYTIANDIMLRKYLGYRNEWKRTYIYPLIASAIMGAIAFGVYQGLFRLTRRPFIALMAAILVAVLVYLVLYVKISGTTKEEMRRFPMGTKLVKVLTLIRIYK